MLVSDEPGTDSVLPAEQVTALLYCYTTVTIWQKWFPESHLRDLYGKKLLGITHLVGASTYHIKTTELGRQYLKRFHKTDLIEYLGETQHPDVVGLIGELEMRELPPLLSSSIPAVRFIARSRMEDLSNETR